MQAILGEEWPLLESALQSAPPVSIRMNQSKHWAAGINMVELGQWDKEIGRRKADQSVNAPDAWNIAAIPWCPNAFYLPIRPTFTLDPAFHAGAYYVQEASSMFVSEAVRQTVDLTKSLRVLDLCAAPGGKSTLLINLLSDTSLLVSNETIRARTGSLRENMERWGHPNLAITSAEVEEFAALEDWFDVVVADAPCSGEGLFRKDPEAVQEWSLPHVDFCASRQKRILAAAVKSLAPGGVLLFSTCTYNRQENDGNLEWLTKEFPLDLLSLDIPASWGIVTTAQGGYQFYPHHLQGEGFFIAVFRKKTGNSSRHHPPASFKSLKPLGKSLVPQVEAWLRPDVRARFFQTPTGEILALPEKLEQEFLMLDKTLKTKWFGVNIGEFKGKDFIPSHALAQSIWVSPGLSSVSLTEEQALLFLKKETFEPQESWPKGWVLASYQGLNLGWMKILPNRMNNYLPQERRIRMAIY
jgi:16S rRNA C967 or C1407 C5-methylase (RsmB/RsmF family)/NOL1/NOP2/fmu family ribosome biogenesis protein